MLIPKFSIRSLLVATAIAAVVALAGQSAVRGGGLAAGFVAAAGMALFCFIGYAFFFALVMALARLFVREPRRAMPNVHVASSLPTEERP